MGGGTIQAIGSARARLVVAAAAVAIATVLGALPAVFGGDRQRLLITLAIVGVGATLLALSGFVAFTWWAVASLGAEYTVFILGRQAVDFRAPIVGGSLFALAELIQWRDGDRPTGETRVRRLADLGMMSFASVGVGTLVLVAGMGGPGSIVVTVVGLVASVAMLALIVVLAIKAPAGVSPEGSGGDGGAADGLTRGSSDGTAAMGSAGAVGGS